MKRLVSAYYEDFYPFRYLGFFTDFHTTSDPADLLATDVLVVWGGGDISPSLYGRAVGKRCGADERLSRRDAIEWGLMQKAKELGCVIIGVCRGGQMLTALAGGYLIQHVDNHAGYGHKVTTASGEEFTVNSIHHQMMMPGDAPHEMLAWSKDVLSQVHFDVDKDVPIEIEPEYIYYPEVKGHAIQWHPEGMKAGSEATQYIFNQIKMRL